ncbi:concanavalin A-like lectin/glucanase [Daldinia caldariorum]|uniref:concanavalin A-like lectin/glucanase n=1 Tax=Daldinia caldariorum TaxID=326644 RepID=UPI00200881E6|nr:concanavalin A-like lectin/glucanase [Daldinia caldariorum]KAI1467937.1 concanavalin A-like lectin/glucanase [Daldinia caldariorum]
MKAATPLNTFFAAALVAPSFHDGFLAARSTEKTSINWSGAVVQGQNISGVTATFPVLDTKIPKVNETGKHAYQGMTWIGIEYPDPPVFVDVGDISAGDIIKVALDAPSRTQASPLCMSSAEWIVERAYSLSGLVGLIDFGTEAISDITYTAGGELHTSIPDDVTIVNIINDEDNNVQQTSTEVSGNTVKVTYLGS